MCMNLNPDSARLRGPTQLSNLLLRQFLRPGDQAVDATCGNGHDTLLLAGLVGPAGRVWGFDVQEEAIRHTRLRLEKAGKADCVELILAGHESMADHVSGQVGAVVFNLGYRPGGDHNIITQPDTTLAALGQALQLLLPAGVLAITVYPGHRGGDSEEGAVSGWCSCLDQRLFHSWRMGQVNVLPGAPFFFMIQKAA